MELSRNLAWQYLTEIEKQHLYMTIGQGVSGTQLREMLGVTPYKYWELKVRSESLFKIFMDYFKTYKELIHRDAPVTQAFKDYITACIQKRLPRVEATYYAGDGKWCSYRIKNKELKSCLEKLRSSSRAHDNDLSILIQEFDRWNSFRILPQQLQSPSPYRRKNTRLLKKSRSMMVKLDTKIINKITMLYSDKNHKTTSKGVTYIALFKKNYTNGYKIFAIPLNYPEAVEYLATNKVYSFSDKTLAESFARLVLKYEFVTTSEQGVRYWREFETFLLQSSNYEEINHTQRSLSISK